MLLEKFEDAVSISISESQWVEVLRMFRLGKGTGIYSLCLSYLNRSYVPEAPSIGIGFDHRNSNYMLVLPGKLNMFRDPNISMARVIKILADYLIPHELEHFLRMHIPRSASLATRSRVVTPKFGKTTTSVLCNWIEDAGINKDLGVNSIGNEVYGILEADDLFKEISGSFRIKEDFVEDLHKLIENDIYGTRGSMIESVFYKIEKMIDDKSSSNIGMGSQGDDGDGVANVVTVGLGSGDVDIQGYLELDGSSISTNETIGKDGELHMSKVLKDDVSKQLLKTLKSAGHDVKELGDLIDKIDEKRYDIDSFLSTIVSYSVTNVIRFSKRIPARRPNAQAGITRFTLAPKVAIAADASGSVSAEFYKEFFRVARTVGDQDGADIGFIIFDTDVVYYGKKVPKDIRKSNGGTMFNPVIERAKKEGYSKLIILTDMCNGDTIPAEPGIEIIYIMEDRSQIQHLSTNGPIEKSYMYELKVDEKAVIPLR